MSDGVEQKKKKRQAALAASLFGIVVVLVIWDFHGTTAVPALPAPGRSEFARTQRTSAKAPVKGAVRSSFHLAFERLTRSEGYDYTADGHNLFGAPASVAIEAPLAPPRPVAVSAPLLLSASAKADPQIDVKYAGFAESASGTINGLFIHGDDISVAKQGDIIFHRFRVGAIQAASAQVTDLGSNQSEPLLVASNK